MNMIIPILTNLLFGFVTSHLAQKRGRDGTTWFVIGILGGVFGLALVYFLPPVGKKEAVGPKNVMNSEGGPFSSWGSRGTDRPESVVKPEVNAQTPISELDMFRQLDWYYMNKQYKQEGPVAYEDLRLAFNSERANEDTLIWSDGMPEWKKLRDLDVILGDFTTPQASSL